MQSYPSRRAQAISPKHPDRVTQSYNELICLTLGATREVPTAQQRRYVIPMEFLCRVILQGKHRRYHPTTHRELQRANLPHFGCYQGSSPTLANNLCGPNGNPMQSYPSRRAQAISPQHPDRVTKSCEKLMCLILGATREVPPPYQRRYVIPMEILCRVILQGKHGRYDPTTHRELQRANVHHFGCYQGNSPNLPESLCDPGGNPMQSYPSRRTQAISPQHPHRVTQSYHSREAQEVSPHHPQRVTTS